MDKKHGIPSGDDSTSSTSYTPEADLKPSSQKSNESEIAETTQQASGTADCPPNKASAFTSSREYSDVSHGQTVVEPEPHLVVNKWHRNVVSSFASRKFNKSLLERIGATFTEAQKQHCCNTLERQEQCKKILEIWTMQATGDHPRLVTDLVHLLEDLKAESTEDSHSTFDEIIEKLHLSLRPSVS
uniref:Uncharacterized protein LOC100180888 n=1 Tax=Phallusia mammillata TaxID=59560 RepID=A0A6F9DHJ4_9ASCI|nr:uncharacterized protein LOC100180888 [Phallusia mammillata]